MRRRGHKSTKVPNVKLRPADPSYKPHQQFQPQISSQHSFRLEDEPESEPEPELPIASSSTSKPFRGVVLCTTGIEDKQLVYIKARELGATCTNDFTSLVTHLVAKTHGGAKYMCAMDRGLPILSLSWITDSYDTWLRGDDIDLASSIESHRLPTFDSIVLCTAGITSLVQRTRIGKLVSQHGGVYIKDLSDQPDEEGKRVTHLICAHNDEDDARIQYAAKVNNKAGWMKIRVVWEEWFWDCLEFKGRFREDGYSIRKPRPERKKPPQRSDPPPVVVKETTPKPTDEEELACVKRPQKVTLQVWASLLGPRGVELDNGSLKLSPSKKAARQFSAPIEEPDDFDSGKSVLSNFRRANSFSLLQRSTSSTGLFSRAPTSTPPPNVPDVSEEHAEPKSAMFEGLRFRLLGEAKVAAVRQVIESAQGIVLKDSDDEDDNVDYIIVRLVSGSKLFQAEDDLEVRSKFRTECWLEHCIFHGSLQPAEGHITFLPLPIPLPIPDADRVFLSISGLADAEVVCTQRLIRALGMTIVSQFTKQATHLVCNDAEGRKYERALEWGVPVVNTDWLSEVARTGKLVGVKEYLVGESKEKVASKALRSSASASSIPAPAPLEMQEIPLPTQSLRKRSSVKTLPKPEPKDSSTTVSSPTTTTSTVITTTTTLRGTSSMSSPVTATSSASSIPPAVLSSPATSTNLSVHPPTSPFCASSPIAVSKELQESINTLLGKRSSPAGAVGQDSSGSGNKRLRRGRMLRADRSNSMSDDVLSSSSFSSGFPVQSEVKPAGDRERVKYEDPGQRDEKARLMRIVLGQQGEEKKRRMPGF